MEEYGNFSLEELLRHEDDRTAWYWIGMAYWERADFINAAKWLERTMNDVGNEWADKATFNLGIAHLGLLPNASRDKALSLFEKISGGVMSKLYAGFLYYEGTETKRDLDRGRKLIEEAISQLIDKCGDDSYLAPDEYFKIARMYANEGNHKKAIEYLTKTKGKCNPSYSSERDLIERAEEGIMEELEKLGKENI